MSKDKVLRELAEDWRNQAKDCDSVYPLTAGTLYECSDELEAALASTVEQCAACGKTLGPDGHPNVRKQLHFDPNFRRAMEKASLLVDEPWPMCDECYHKGIWTGDALAQAKETK